MSVAHVSHGVLGPKRQCIVCVFIEVTHEGLSIQIGPCDWYRYHRENEEKLNHGSYELPETVKTHSKFQEWVFLVYLVKLISYTLVDIHHRAPS